MTRSAPRIAAIVALTAAALFATACAPTEAQSDPARTPTVEIEPSSPAPAPSASSSGDAQIEEPTCATIISSTTVEDFESLGWSSLADTFVVGDVTIPDGVRCIWGDFSTASDHVQVFGWAPISGDQATQAQNELVAQGWIREQSPDGVYVTENPETAVAVDDEGYGMTYLFADGWVKLADTKQGLLLVQWPPS